MAEEIEALKKKYNNTCIIEDLPPRKKP